MKKYSFLILLLTLTLNLNAQIKLDSNFELLDFNVLEQSESYNRVSARIRSISNKYLEYIRLAYNFHKDDTVVLSEVVYVDYYTFGSYGSLPYQISLMEDMYVEKVEYDSLSFSISYSEYDDRDGYVWDQLLKLETSYLIRDGDYYTWSGTVRNDFNYSVDYPKVFVCYMKNSKMIDMEYVYIDVPNYKFPPNSSGTFNKSYCQPPTDYDEKKIILVILLRRWKVRAIFLQTARHSRNYHTKANQMKRLYSNIS